LLEKKRTNERKKEENEENACDVREKREYDEMWKEEARIPREIGNTFDRISIVKRACKIN
jgi:hypothetical protein